MANAAGWLLDRHIEAGRDSAIAFVDPTRTLTYGHLATASARFAGGLRAAGIAREQRVALLLLDTCDFPIAFFGCLRAGVVPVPINTLLPAEQVAYILADMRAAAVVVSPALRALVPDGPWRIVEDVAAWFGEAATTIDAADDEVAFWLYSSGSTGAPKGTRHVHGSLRATAETYGAQVLKLRADDVVYSAAKLFFAYGLGNALTFPMAVGAQTILLPDRPTPASVRAVMERHQPSVFCGVPTLYAAMLADPTLPHGIGSARLRRCISAGEALPEHIGLRWREQVGTDILDGIGSTEMLHIFVSNRDEALSYGSSGIAVPGYDLRIVDEQDRDLPDGETGELLVRGPSAADGYWNQRAKSRRTFMGEWTRTGDKYLRDAEGFYRYQGRADDMFKVSGIWVSPFEVEAALVAHADVQEAAVIGREDADGLVKPMAFVVLKPGTAAGAGLEAALKAEVQSRAGPWKYPRWIEIVDDLPKTATGKIQRFKLRAGVAP